MWAGAGWALFASPAAAGGVDDRGRLMRRIYNYTPYTWTLVDYRSPAPCPYNDPTGQNRCWAGPPTETVSPGETPIYQLDPNDNEGSIFGQKFGYDASFTYRVDVLEGGAGVHDRRDLPVPVQRHYGSSIARVLAGTRLPRRRPGGTRRARAAGPQTANPQLTYQPGPQLFDVTVTAVGNFSVDASTDLGRPFVDLLNSACAGADNTSCSFTPDGSDHVRPRRRWRNRHQTQNCDLTAAAGGEPDGWRWAAQQDPNYMIVEYEAAQSASLSVGGGVTASAPSSASSARSPRRRR